MEDPIKRPEKIKLTEINPYLTCYLCKGYLIDATTISECLHSFCRSCIIKFLQDNSYCPVCEVIINKAKPNLKLDKTLQDIVYKLVPELFLREMTRRKQYYQQYPQVAARVSPEDRGEDTERTIFNPQDCISLSMEYISADSSPGAIKLLGPKNGSDKSDQLSPEENQALMKRYLQCPGMCRVDVLKKFVRNKYNVDTSLFHIDILYKRVPLPDHYTLIDIAYIYSWKRNEPMKFFFRITDLNKVSERFDYFDSENPTELIVQLPLRRSNGTTSNRRKEHVTSKKKTKQEVQNQANVCDKPKIEVKKVVNGSDSSETFTEAVCDKEKVEEQKLNNNKENVKVEEATNKRDTNEQNPKRFILKIRKDPEKDSSKTEDDPGALKDSVISTPDTKDNKNSVTHSNVDKPEVSGHLKNNCQNQQKNDNSVYTGTTVDRTNNAEIVKRIQKLTNKECQSVGLRILEQASIENEAALKQEKVPSGGKSLVKLKPNSTKVFNKNNNFTELVVKYNNASDTKNKIEPENTVHSTSDITTTVENKEKIKFLENFQLTTKNLAQKTEFKQPQPSPNNDLSKRKSSTLKTGSPKKIKIDKKPVTRIILQPKPKPTTSPQTSEKSQGLQSLIENCKIPSSLSITIKDGSENNKIPSMMLPVKNYIEILKLPDENKNIDCNKLNLNTRLNDDSEQKVDEDLAEIAKSLTEKIPMSTTISQIVGPKPEFSIPVKTNVPAKYVIQPSPVPELSNKLLNVPKDKLNPRSPQSFQKIFEESIKKPDPDTPEVSKPSDSSNEVTSTSNGNNKRNILEIASQLYKKTKLELEKNQSNSQIDSTTTPKAIPKVPIPRLPHQRNLKTSKSFDGVKLQQSLANMHSNALGLNYTISVGPNVSPKKNGVIAKKEAEVKVPDKPIEAKPGSFTPPCASPKPSSLPRNISPGLGYNSPKHSPKSSPMIKHMYAPMLMDQLRVNTYTPKSPSPKIVSFKGSPNFPSSSTSSKSPNTTSVFPEAASPKPSSVSPKPSSTVLSISTPQVTVPSKTSPKPSSSNQIVPQGSPLSPNQILERYNIQNLAQLTASLNFNSSNFGLSSSNQLAAFQHAMLLKHFEMQNRQNWLNMNQGSLLQYEKYLQNLQNLKTAQNQLLGNIKEN